jgi:tetratricopeptide (TPR) repeat protein/predicted Ser/Thr protein kinase
MIGKILSNRYKLISELGNGGMAWVYLGEDLRDRRQVAVKILYPQLGEDMGFIQRFNQEAKLVMGLSQSLSERHIVRVLDYGSDRDIRYLVMEYVEGRDLRRVLDEEGPLPWQQALDITCQIALALQYAFQQGIVHRDIKPANVMLRPDGTVRVLDFGIARARTSPTLTHSGFVGSPFYVAPEQAMGQRVDIRADLYSLGVVLYEMLTGDRPFESDTPWVVINHHIATPPPPLENARPDLPVSLARLVRRALAKRPADRFQEPGDLMSAVETILSGQELATDSWPIAPDARTVLLDGLYAKAHESIATEDWRGAVDLFSQILRLDPRYHDVTEQLAEAGRQARIAALYNAAQLSIKAGYWDDALAQLDDLTRFAPGYRDIEALRARARQGYEGQHARLRGNYYLATYDWTPQVEAFDEAFKPILGRAKTTVPPSPDQRMQQEPVHPASAEQPPASQPARSSRRPIWVMVTVLLLGLALISLRLPHLQAPRLEASDTFTANPTISPSSIPIAATLQPSPATIIVSQEPPTLTPSPFFEPTSRPPSPEPAASRTLTQAPMDGPTATLTRTQVRVSEATPTVTLEPPHPTPSQLMGQIAFPRFDPARSTYDVYACHVDGSNCKLLATEASQPTFLPCGTRLAFHSWKADDKGLILQLLSGERLWRITDDIEAARPSVDFHGNLYVYHSRHGADRLPYLYRTESTESWPIVREANPVPGQSPSWLPDGRILYSGCLGDHCGIIVTRTDGTQPRQVAAGTAEINPVASPDGQRVIFMSQRDGNWEIYVVNLDGSALKRLTNNPTNDGLPVWSPDGQHIAFVSDRDDDWAVWVMRPDGNDQRRLFGLGGPLDGQVRDAAPHEIHGWVEERISWSQLP